MVTHENRFSLLHFCCHFENDRPEMDEACEPSGQVILHRGTLHRFHLEVLGDLCKSFSDLLNRHMCNASPLCLFVCFLVYFYVKGRLDMSSSSSLTWSLPRPQDPEFDISWYIWIEFIIFIGFIIYIPRFATRCDPVRAWEFLLPTWTRRRAASHAEQNLDGQASTQKACTRIAKRLGTRLCSPPQPFII